MARDGRVIATLDDAALSDPRVDQLKLTPPEVVKFAGRDGTDFYGAYYAPRSKPSARRPRWSSCSTAGRTSSTSPRRGR